MSRWVHELLRCKSTGKDCVLVTVVSTRGSAPREAGTRMLVTGSEVVGSIGGGNLEFKSIGIARDMLVTGSEARMQRFPLGASLGQCCGGVVNLLFEPVMPTATWPNALCAAIDGGESCKLATALHGDHRDGKLLLVGDAAVGSLPDTDRQQLLHAFAVRGTHQGPEVVTVNTRAYLVETVAPAAFKLYLFGAGHVGRALVKILGELDCCVTWIDSRESEFPDAVPANVICMVSDEPADAASSASADAYFLVMTHSHTLDHEIAESILRRDDVAWFGLIGSRTKRRLFETRLHARGICAERRASMICPIGNTRVSSKEPMAIALGVATQILEFSERQMQAKPAQNSKTPVLAGISGQKPARSRASA